MAQAPPSTKLPLASLSITDDKLARLHELLPEVFSEGKVDFEKLKLALGKQVDTGPERYGLNWAGKSEAIRTLQAPGAGTLLPCPDESVNFDTSENLIIEGDNLEVLKLLQKSYYGKVKMIYIDPPYNTGNDFIYNDDFRDSLNNYLRFSGQIDEEGNATTSDQNRSGRFHSNWLNMMYPRLYLARNLLREDGVIFVSIDDNEAHNLRLLMNEVFGEENCISTIIWHSKYTTSNDVKHISRQHEYVLFYCKNIDLLKSGLFARTAEMDASYTNPDNDPRGPWKATPLHAKSGSGTYTANFNNGITWSTPDGRYPRFAKTRLMQMYQDGRLWFGKDGKGTPSAKTYLSEVKSGKTPGTIFSYENAGSSHKANEQLADLVGKGIFDNPKPPDLIRMIATLANLTKNDIALDFFGGSGTTAQAVMELNEADGGNRKFILVQLPEKTDKPEYPTIAHITRERVRRVIQKMQAVSKQGLGFRALRLSSSNFKPWDGGKAGDTVEQLAAQLELHAHNVDMERSEQDVLFELILKGGLPLSATIQTVTLGKQQGFRVHSEGRVLLICLAQSIQQTTLDAMREHKADTLICLDMAFAGNDPLKTNAVLQMRDAGIRFYTV